MLNILPPAIFEAHSGEECEASEVSADADMRGDFQRSNELTTEPGSQK